MPTKIRMLTALSTLLLVILASTTSAQAKRVLAPPGNSGVSQYYEVVPSAEGGVAPGAHSPNHSRVLTPSTERDLKAAGAEGQAVASFAQATGTPTRATATAGHSASSPTHKSSGSAAVGRSTYAPLAGQISRAASVSSGSLGWGLPLALGLIAMAAALIVGLRRRRSG